MCRDCFNAHEILKESFEGHRVTPVNEFKEEDYEALLKRQPFCSQEFHERKITRFFCFSCEACVCQICIVTDHQNHKIVLLDKAARDEKPGIMSGAEMIKEKIRQLGEVIRQFEETASELERNVATAKRGVSHAADQMIAEIREREGEAIISFETTRVTRLEKINTAIQEAQSLVKQMNQAVEFANNLTQRSSSSDIMRNKITLKQRFEELRVIEVPNHGETSFVKFRVASRVGGLELGFIESAEIKADANRSWLEGLDHTFQAGVEAEFTLYPKTSEGKTSNQADLKDQVEVLIEPAKDVTKVIVSEKEDGNLDVKFTPIVPGAYSIEVKINDNKLSTCPFATHVKERELVVVGSLDLTLFQGNELRGLFGIAVNKEGVIVVTDNNGHCVYVFDKEGNCSRKIGDRGTNSGQFQNPEGVSFLSDNEILIADCCNHRIQHLNIETGTVVKTFGKSGAGKGEFQYPFDVCLDDEGRILVVDFGNNRIQVISKEGETLSIFGDNGPEKLNFPIGCIPFKDVIFVSDHGNDCIKVFDKSGSFLYKFGKQGIQDGQFNQPRLIHVDSSNYLLVCDFGNNRVQQFSLDGRFTGKSTAVLPKPTGIATASDGSVLVTSCTDKKVYILK